jgi:tetratricopeptide (TPR) repeat protein
VSEVGAAVPPARSDAGLRRWTRTGLVALAVIVAAVPLSLLRSGRAVRRAAPLTAAPAFVGSAACKDCHAVAWERWSGSDHDLAMAVATERTVLGDFGGAVFSGDGITARFYRKDGKYFVFTEGPGGVPAELEITHTFGVRPLQQYLVPTGDGRLQALSVAWDVGARRWFFLYPGQRIPPTDWLHWTRNGQNWNGMCAECHSTNLKKGYDPETRSYRTTWSDINVGCEACHGPGSRHVAWAAIPDMARPAIDNAGLAQRTSGISGPQLVELCAPCHARRAELGDYDHTGAQLLDHMLPSLLDAGLYEADGQDLDEVYTYGSFLQSKMYARGVRCSDCHDSHTLKLHREGNELCLQCHQREVYDTADHHFHKQAVGGRPSPGAACIKCHMVERPFMVIDWRADHSLRLPRPDLTRDIGVPNACTQGGCHDDKPLAWSIDAYRRWYGLARRPHYGTTFAAARRGEPGAGAELARLARDPLQPAIVRATALSLLDRYPGPASAETLRAAALADEPLLRCTAAAAVAVADPAERVALLAPLLADPVRAVRLAAVAQLAGVPRELLRPYQREALERGIAEQRAAMAYSLDFASSGLNLGNLEAALGNAANAERYYRLALGVDDLFFPAKVNLAVLLSGQGRNDEAERLLREVRAAYPGNSEAAYSLGLLLVEMERPEEAVTLLTQVVTAEPRFARARYNLGLLLQRLGRLDAAERELAAAAELEPANADFLYALAHHLLRSGRTAAALPPARRLTELRPGDADAAQLLAAARRAAAGGAAP